jgi:hypothetical protein
MKKPRWLAGLFLSFVGGNCRENFRSHSDFSRFSIALMKNRFILAASALLGAALAQTSCQAPVPSAPKAEPIDAVQSPSASKPAPAKPASPAVAPHKVKMRQAPLSPASFTRFIEQPYRRKVKYGKRRWVLV